MDEVINDFMKTLENNPESVEAVIFICAILFAVFGYSKKKSTKIGIGAFLLIVTMLVVHAYIPSGYRLVVFIFAVMMIAIGLLYSSFEVYARKTRFINIDPNKKTEEELKILLEEQKDDPDPKYCPKCGARMVFSKQLLNNFYSCSNYPECKYYEKIEKFKKIDEEL